MRSRRLVRTRNRRLPDLHRDVRRDEYPNLSRLAWQAKRRSGSETLEVLQDALMTHFYTEFRAARRQAVARKERRGSDQYVIFVPSLERERRKPERSKRLRLTHAAIDYYKKHLPGEPTNVAEYKVWMSKKRYPFTITNKPLAAGESAVIVWGTDVKFKTHPLNLQRKQGLTKEQFNRLVRVNNARYGLGRSGLVSTEGRNLETADDVLLRKGFIRHQRGLVFVTRKGRKYIFSDENKGYWPP